MEKKPTSGHVIGTNAQLQALRPELVKLGFVDDPGVSAKKIYEAYYEVNPE